MKNMIIITILYLVGLVLFLLTGVCQFDAMFCIALAIGIAGGIGVILKFKNIKNN